MIAWLDTLADDPREAEFMIWLYHEFKPIMFATAKKYVSNPQDCEDIVQDSLERLVKKISLLRQKERCVLACYVVLTVRNTSINHLKKQASAQKIFVNLSDQRDDPLSPEPSLDDWLMLIEDKERLYRIWKQLTREEQLLLSGKYILEYSDAELAGQLGCAPASVRMKLTRVRRKARKLMDMYEGETI